MKFRIVWYNTDSDDKFDYSEDNKFEFFGNAKAMLRLWFILTKKMNAKHVEVYNLEGDKCEPEKGIHGMFDYN